MRRGRFLITLALLLAPPHAQAKSKTWHFDKLERIGGFTPHVEGAPKIIHTPLGKAMLFNGVDDALFIDNHPLAGAKHFTFEAIIRPDGGAVEQRWFYLAGGEPEAPNGTPAAKPIHPRFTFELRVVGGAWYLDTFITGTGYKQTLAFPEKLYPLGHYYAVAQSYDGHVYRSYVNGVLQGEAALTYTPQAAGRASVGVRINHVDYFKGVILKARFSDVALKPAQFLHVPPALTQGDYGK
jgi:Concanavalin A-like lectin/glucanases superfamily